MSKQSTKMHPIKRARLKQPCRLPARFCLHIVICTSCDFLRCAPLRIAFLFQRHDASCVDLRLFCRRAGASSCAWATTTLPTFDSEPEKFVIDAAPRRGDHAPSLRK